MAQLMGSKENYSKRDSMVEGLEHFEFQCEGVQDEKIETGDGFCILFSKFLRCNVLQCSYFTVFDNGDTLYLIWLSHTSNLILL